MHKTEFERERIVPFAFVYRLTGEMENHSHGRRVCLSPISRM